MVEASKEEINALLKILKKKEEMELQRRKRVLSEVFNIKNIKEFLENKQNKIKSRKKYCCELLLHRK